MDNKEVTEVNEATWDKVNAILEEAFPDCHQRFMQPCVTDLQKWYLVESNNGESYWMHEANTVYKDDDGNFLNDEDLFFEDGIVHAGEYTIEEKQGYGAQMEAPGYIDQTSWSVFDSPIDAAEYLAEYYSDNDCNCKEEAEDEPLEDDIVTYDHLKFYQFHKLYATVGEDEDWEKIILDKMNNDKFWPSVWFISDHGNAHLMTWTAKDDDKGDDECHNCHGTGIDTNNLFDNNTDKCFHCDGTGKVIPEIVEHYHLTEEEEGE